jgi:predicted O-methyltransferase YrrM
LPEGAFTLYLPVLKLLESRLSPGALVIAENAVEQSGEYLTYVRNPENDYLTIPLPFGANRGNEMSVRTA